MTSPSTAARGIGPAAMLTILTLSFLLSNVYRTLPAILAASLTAEFDLSAGDLGLFAASFHVAFALPQLAIGVALDRYGPRRFVWGSDMPNVERYCTYRQTLTYFADSADYLSDDDRKLIFRENALALFRR